MKKILFLLILLYPLIVCGGCGDKEARIQENTARYDTAYNVRTGVSVSLGESEEAIKEKFAEDEYEIVPFTNQYEQKDPLGRYRYEFTYRDSMYFAIAITDGVVTGLGIYPVHSFGFSILPPRLRYETDWYFKGGITVGINKDVSDEIFGIPSSHAGIYGDHNCVYAFTDDFYLLTPAEYEANREGDDSYAPNCYAIQTFGRDELIASVIRYGYDPYDVPKKQFSNYDDNLVGTPNHNGDVK